jgi:hypothetical protein
VTQSGHFRLADIPALAVAWPTKAAAAGSASVTCSGFSSWPQPAKKSSKKTMLKQLWKHADAIEKDFASLKPEQRVMSPFAAEIAAVKLLRLLGIGCAPRVMVVSGAEALALDPRKWILKGADGKVLVPLAALAPSPVLAVAKTPRAVPISFLRQHYGIAPDIPVIESDGMRFTMNGIIWRGKPALAGAAEFYGDFRPPSDWSAILEAVSWDSAPMLKIHAARLFLGATTAHASNILVNAAAQLFSVDHADLAKTDGSEIDMLFEHVAKGTRAWDALYLIAALSEPIVEGIFAETSDHYIARLRRWRRNVEVRT